MTAAPLLLLPGLLCDRELWTAQIDALGDVAAIAVADLTRADSMAGLAADALAAVPERFALAGLSMGGYVAFEIMRRAPERVTRLALLDTSALPDAPEQTRRRRDLIALSEKGEFRGVTAQLLAQWVQTDRMQEPAFVERVGAMTRRVGREAFARQQTAIMNRPDSRPGLAAIRVPTLVLCGRQDAATPVERHREIAADVPDSRLVVIEACGHLSPLEKPEAVSAALRAWLA
jgi:pimeloyl-ACP methyl ester carboxylesterase